jgi:ADP-ribose pyrophosphatase YjhB (NUDIX family)
MESTELVNVRCSTIVFRNNSVLLLRREKGGAVDWVLPGGTPRQGESVASCARREVAEETGLLVTVDRVAFVLEASNPAEDVHLLDLVFTGVEQDRSVAPQAREPGLMPVFHPVEELGGLPLRPPLAGHLRSLHGSQRRSTGAYLGNMWRPSDLAAPGDDVSMSDAGREVSRP